MGAPLVPIAKFDANPTTGVAPLVVICTCQSEHFGGNETYWYIDGLYAGQGETLVCEFSEPGRYDIGLEVRNADGSNISFQKIDVKDRNAIPATVSFEADPETGTAPLEVSFADTSSIPYATSWTWDLGDGTTVGNDRNISHVYQNAGNYTVTLTHSGAGVEPISATRTIVVAEAVPQEKIYPIPDYALSVTTGPAPLLIEYHDLSLNADSVLWEFGTDEDDVVSRETSSLRDGKVSLKEPGVYTVRLTATNMNGSVVKQGTINVTEAETGDGIVYLPVASFTASTLAGNKPLSVSFADTSANATSVEWFVNGVSVATGNEMDYVFPDQGEYNVSLVAHNGTYSDQATKTITVWDDPLQLIKYPPVAGFTANATGGEAPLCVEFADRSVNATDVVWDINLNGDQVGSSSDRSMVYTFTLPGNYTVTLYATNVDGADEETMSIVVTKGEEVVIPDPQPDVPIARFDANVTQGEAPLCVEFTDRSSNASELRWTVDGVPAGDGHRFEHCFVEAGEHQVVLTAINGQLSSSASEVITVVAKAADDGDDDTDEGEQGNGTADDEQNGQGNNTVDDSGDDPVDQGNDTQDDQSDETADDNGSVDGADGSTDEGDDVQDDQGSDTEEGQADEADEGAEGDIDDPDEDAVDDGSTDDADDEVDESDDDQDSEVDEGEGDSADEPDSGADEDDVQDDQGSNTEEDQVDDADEGADEDTDDPNDDVVDDDGSVDDTDDIVDDNADPGDGSDDEAEESDEDQDDQGSDTEEDQVDDADESSEDSGSTDDADDEADEGEEDQSGDADEGEDDNVNDPNDDSIDDGYSDGTDDVVDDNDDQCDGSDDNDEEEDEDTQEEESEEDACARA